MQKWIRDRMRRRKKKPAEGSAETTEVTPPLQPIYPESESEPQSEPVDGNADSVEETEPQTQEQQPEEQASEAPVEQPRPKRRRKKKPAKPAVEPAPVEENFKDSESPEPAASAEVPAQDEAKATEPSVDEAAAAETPESAVPEPAAATAPVQASAAPAAPAKGKRASKGAVVLAVGLPGSGKSTWFKRHAVTPLSSDMVRHLLFDNPTEQRYQDLVFGTLRSLLRARLIARMPMNYVDATNLSPKERRHWIRMAKDFGYDAHAVYFDVPLEVCMDRNKRRNRVVPEDVMHRMSAKLRPPTFDEGFAKIIVVRVKPKAESPAAETGTNETAD